MIALGVILARAGSKGLPQKCTRELLGRTVLEFTFDHAFESRLLTALVLTTDSPRAKQLARRAEISVIDRPASLAGDASRVDSTVRHAVEEWERSEGSKSEIVVILYGNIPVRPEGLVDRAIEHLQNSGADSVRSVARVMKHHPDWLHRLDGDQITPFRPNSIDRRQDLEPLFYHDGAVIAVTRQSLFAAANSTDPHAFFGEDRRAIVLESHEVVDIDDPIDLHLAEAVLRAVGENIYAPAI